MFVCLANSFVCLRVEPTCQHATLYIHRTTTFILALGTILILTTFCPRQVSWIRLRDFHLLTIGSLTYIQDDRFAVRPTSHSTNDWSLQIKHVTVKDEGTIPPLSPASPFRTIAVRAQLIVTIYC